MKEFTSQTGGRYTYIDDIVNLQDLSLAFASIFNGCGNFIISGCEVSGSSISAGYVYINGKIRYCSGASGLSKWPTYIYESNSTEKVSYADSGDKIGRNIYGCAISNSVPTTNDALTGNAPQSISIASDGSALRLKDAFFGKYALMVDSPYDSQTVEKKVSFNGEITTNSGIVAKQAVSIVQNNTKARLYYDTNSILVLESKADNGTPCELKLTNNGEFQFYVNSVLVAKITGDVVYFAKSIQSTKAIVGSVAIQDNNIFNNSVSNNDGCLYINGVSHQGKTNYYRTTIVGDGKGAVLLSLNGKTQSGSCNIPLTIGSSTGSILTLKNSTLSSSDKTLTDYIAWQDKEGISLGNIGYTSNTDSNFYINNKVGDIVLDNNVSITGSLLLGDINVASRLSEYATLSSMLTTKANSSDVYDKTTSDSRYVKSNDSISVFVQNAGSQDKTCELLGAATKTELASVVMKANLFTDIVNEGLPSASSSTYITEREKRQRQLCENIGALYSADAAKIEKDTGWIEMTVTNCSIITKLYVRQVGKVVSIQGQLHTHHSGTIFTLPNSIDPPKYEIGYSHSKGGDWHCTILSGQRDCKVDYCSNGCSEYIGFLMTYLV